MVDDPADVDAILRITKGRWAVEKMAANNEGYVSWFMDRPPQLFARTWPDAGGMPNVIHVAIDRSHAFFDQYQRHRFGPEPSPSSPATKVGTLSRHTHTQT